jgi:hypothetical protein
MKHRKIKLPWLGFEPQIFGLPVHCSTNNRGYLKLFLQIPTLTIVKLGWSNSINSTVSVKNNIKLQNNYTWQEQIKQIG